MVRSGLAIPEAYQPGFAALGLGSALHPSRLGDHLARRVTAIVQGRLALLLPVIWGYAWWSYRVFSGKVAAYSGYH